MIDGSDAKSNRSIVSSIINSVTISALFFSGSEYTCSPSIARRKVELSESTSTWNTINP